MAARIRALPWAETPLGPTELWSPSLKVAVQLTLAQDHPTWLCVGERRTQLYNDSYAPLIGVRHPAALGSDARKTLGGRDLWATLARVFTGETVERREVLEQARFDVSAVPVRDETGTVFAAMLLYKEEAVLDESEARFRALVTAASDVVYRVSPDWREMRRLHGRGFLADTPEPRPNWLRAYVPPEDQPRVLEAIQHAIRDKALFQLEHRVRRADGSLGWTSSCAVPILDVRGEILEWFGAAHDVTARRENEEALRTSDQRQAFLLALSDTLRPIGDATQAQTAAMRLLAQQLGVSRADYLEVDESGRYVDRRGGYAGDLPSSVCRLDLTAFGRGPKAAFDAGRTFVVPNTADLPVRDERAAYEASGTRSVVGVPVVKAGKLLAVLAVSHREPRAWSPGDIAIIEDTAERVWVAAERSRAEAALQESEARYRGLIDAISSGYCVIEVIFDDAEKPVDYVFLETNPAFEAQTGLADAVGKSVRALAPRHEEFWFETYGRVVRTGEAARFEHRVKELGRWYKVFAARVGAPEQHRVAVLFEDVEERRLRELHTAFLDEIGKDFQQLSSPEDIMRTIGTRIGTFLDVSGCFVQEVSGARGEFSVQYGWTAERVPNLRGTFRLKDYLAEEPSRHGHAAETFVVRDTAADERTNAENCARLKIGAFVAIPVLQRRRSAAYFVVTNTTRRDWRRDEIALLGELADRLFFGIEHARAEATLRASEARQRALLEGMPQLVWRSTPEGEWIWAGPQWVAFTGLSRKASLGRGWLSAVHPDDRPAVLAAWASARAAGWMQTDYRLLQATSGRYLWFRTRGVPVQGEDARVTEWIGTSTDVNDQMLAREVLARGSEQLEALVAERTAELVASKERLRQAQKMEALGQLTGGIAHDFNNMLQGVVGGLEMARRRVETGRLSEATRYLDAGREAAARAAGLTRRLLAFARRQHLEPAAVDAARLVRGLADLIHRTMGPSIEVELKLGDGAETVWCDRNELESVLLNLCINARDAMPDGGRLLIATENAELTARDVAGQEGLKPGAYVALTVTDAGSGMPPEVVERVFDPFFTTKPRGKGTGLGLSQVWGFAQQSGGLVQIETALGEGTTVRLLLPRHTSVATAEAAPSAPPALAGANAACTVLLVEDEETVRRAAADRLRELGFAVAEAADGPDALRALDALQPDLLVTDVGLPGGMNGRQVAEEARRRSPALPVLFVSGYAAAPLPSGADVMEKPFELDALARRIQAILDAKPR